MLTTLNGMFLKPKPHRIDFIKENKKKLREISSMVNQNSSKSRFDITKTKGSQTEVTRSTSGSSTVLKENKITTSSSCRLTNKGSVAVFLNEKKEKGNISCVSLSSKQKSSHKVNMLKNQSCQTIDPRRCDQLYHEGTIKYPSNRVLQELAEIERQKANRLDAHVKKEYFRRNKIKPKNSKKLGLHKPNFKGSGKGDEIEEIHSSSSEDKDEEDEKFLDPEPEPGSEPVQEPEPEPEKHMQSEIVLTNKGLRQYSKPTMRAAEIIRKTTEEINYTPRTQAHNEYNPSNKGDSKLNKKFIKKLSKEDEVLKTVLDPQCPPGHIPLPDTERKKTLHMLRVSHAELVREMNLLPVRTDTLRVRQRKIQLEHQLNKIEEGIKVFNKSKVYVKIEE